MTQPKINRLNAAITTVAFCETAASLAATASITNFAPTVALAKSKIVIIQGFNILADTPIKGITLDLKAIRTSMMEHTLSLSSAVFAYAASLSSPDHDLMAQAKLSKTYLKDVSKEKCATECGRIHKLAAANAANIAPFGASATDITDTQSLISLFMTGINHPRAAVISRTNAIRQASLHLQSLMNNLLTLQLDTMANTLRYKNTAWWNQYHLSREIIDLGKTFTKIQVLVHDQNDTPVKGALVSLLQNNTIIYSKKSDAQGKLSIVKIKPGDYDLKIEKSGFTPQSESDIHFASGKELTRHIIL